VVSINEVIYGLCALIGWECFGVYIVLTRLSILIDEEKILLHPTRKVYPHINIQ